MTNCAALWQNKRKITHIESETCTS